MVDYKTDKVIQRSLRDELKKDVTVITVAHRLQTIMDSDQIASISHTLTPEDGTLSVLKMCPF